MSLWINHSIAERKVMLQQATEHHSLAMFALTKQDTKIISKATETRSLSM